MNNSMIGAMVTMSGVQKRLDMIAENVANVNTVGYKSRDASFEDVLSRVQQQPEAFRQTGRAMPLGFNLGFGVRAAAMSTDMKQGSLKETGNPTDLAIEGNGLFAIEVNGQKAWTRNGSFSFTPDPLGTGLLLTTSEGHAVLDRDGVPVTAALGSKVAIDKQGNLLVRDQGNGDPYVAHRLQIVEPQRSEGLVQGADNTFVLANGVTEADVFGAGAAAAPVPATIRQGYLEQSNVDLTDEMTDMMQIQRMFQMASRALTSSDTLMGLANSLRA
ncbi:flagellar hook-basal body protein [Paenibacillus enshidis]|uniref:Flagellar hook-basal body protein n=1 Tax=Paenibacillus enshidis TaxID=1458439 RepID=A0ABV5ARV2_9BACL